MFSRKRSTLLLAFLIAFAQCNYINSFAFSKKTTGMGIIALILVAIAYKPLKDQIIKYWEGFNESGKEYQDEEVEEKERAGQLQSLNYCSFGQLPLKMQRLSMLNQFNSFGFSEPKPLLIVGSLSDGADFIKALAEYNRDFPAQIAHIIWEQGGKIFADGNMNAETKALDRYFLSEINEEDLGILVISPSSEVLNGNKGRRKKRSEYRKNNPDRRRSEGWGSFKASGYPLKKILIIGLVENLDEIPPALISCFNIVELPKLEFEDKVDILKNQVGKMMKNPKLRQVIMPPFQLHQEPEYSFENSEGSVQVEVPVQVEEQSIENIFNLEELAELAEPVHSKHDLEGIIESSFIQTIIAAREREVVEENQEFDIQDQIMSCFKEEINKFQQKQELQTEDLEKQKEEEEKRQQFLFLNQQLLAQNQQLLAQSQRGVAMIQPNQ